MNINRWKKRRKLQKRGEKPSLSSFEGFRPMHVIRGKVLIFELVNVGKHVWSNLNIEIEIFMS